MDYYELYLVGIERKLPLIKVGKNTSIASLNLLGDVELVDALADEIASKLKNLKFDYLVGPEVKVVPLIHGVAKRLGQKKFIVCRKSAKPYMLSPVTVKPLSHFPKHAKPLVLDGSDAMLLKDKSVVILDDVVSTGVTMRMMEYLMKKVGAKVIKTYCVIKQGEQFDNLNELNYLSELPVFKDSKSN